MKASDLFNSRKEEFETNETFAKRVYLTVKRFRSSLILTDDETERIIWNLSRYYKENFMDIVSAIRDIEYNHPSKKYRIQYVNCLGRKYLAVDKRQSK